MAVDCCVLFSNPRFGYSDRVIHTQDKAHLRGQTLLDFLRLASHRGNLPIFEHKVSQVCISFKELKCGVQDESCGL